MVMGYTAFLKIGYFCSGYPYYVVTGMRDVKCEVKWYSAAYCMC